MDKPRKYQPPTRKDADGLTPKQRKLIDAMLEGASSVSEAGRIAGYAGPDGALKAWQLEHVQSSFMALARGELSRDVGLALATRRRLMQSARSEYVQLEASKDTLDRAGLGKPDDAGFSVQAVNIQISLD